MTVKYCDVCGKSEGRVSLCSKYGMTLCERHRGQMKTYGKILERTKYDPNEIIVNGDIIEIVMYNNDSVETGRAISNTKFFNLIGKHKWCIDNKGYVSCKINGKRVKLHRLISNAPEGMLVDHINHNTLDNREENLRVCTNQENMFNQKIKPNSVSGYKGVIWDKKRNMWRAQIKVNGKQDNLGLFCDINKAISVRKEAEIKHFGEFRYQQEAM